MGRLILVWDSFSNKYHLYDGPQEGVECISLCGDFSTSKGGETKTPGAPNCKLCLDKVSTIR